MIKYRSWSLVSLTFVVVLLISGVAALLTLHSIGGLRSSVLNLIDRHQVTRDHIEALRSEMYLSSILVRDLLLDHTEAGVSASRKRLRQNRSAALSDINALQRLSSAQSRSAVASLATEVDAYWQSVDALLTEKPP